MFCSGARIKGFFTSMNGVHINDKKINWLILYKVFMRNISPFLLESFSFDPFFWRCSVKEIITSKVAEIEVTVICTVVFGL